MAETRLASRIWVGVLQRRVNAAGGFVTVLARGDDIAGSVALVLREGRLVRAVQRRLGANGSYDWSVAATGDSVETWVAKQRGFDPDLWVVELDVPDAARFIDGTISTD